jgi:nucleoside-diphosphate-sugar epimerase
MTQRLVLVTGSAGLIGRNLVQRLKKSTWQVIGADLAKEHSDFQLDVCDDEQLAARLPGVTGIVHLAGVSRVIDGERDPIRCNVVNVLGTKAIVRRASEATLRPWIIFASSREIYGEQAQLPVSENAEPRPMNCYANSKLQAERLVHDSGLRGAVLRFSSVYGDIIDHADRVTPAFCMAAASGGTMRVEGSDHGFDFTHVDDVVDGICRMIELVDTSREIIAPTHLVSGRLCSLEQLAALAIAAADTQCCVIHAPARSFDVHRFVGNPRRAAEIIGWRSTTSLEVGIHRLVQAHINPRGIETRRGDAP